MSEVRFQAESTLIEQQKKKETSNKQVGGSKPSGIDFKNDTILVAARVSFQDAQAVENSKLLDKTSASAELSHTESDISSLLGNYQNLVNQLTQAQSQSESLSTRQQSVLEKLAAQNETVDGLDRDKTTSADVISNLSSQISSAESRKSSAESRKSSAEGRKSSADATVASLDGQITTLRGQITEEMTAEAKANIESQISALESQKASEQAKANAAQADIDAAQADINAADSTLRDLRSQKTAEEANFARIEKELAEAVMVLTGLTLEQASVAALLKEAQTYETNLQIQLEQTEAKIAAKEAEKDEKQKVVDSATKKATNAADNTNEKEAIYHQEETAAETRAKEKEEKDENKNIFMA